MKKIYYIAGFVMLTGALWSVMWIFSSASLASGFCEGQFNLFHEHFRCRQPYIASILFLLLLAVSIILFVLGRRSK